MKIIYDINETDSDKKCYLIDDTGVKTPILFWKIKINDGFSESNLNRWPIMKVQIRHYSEFWDKIKKGNL